MGGIDIFGKELSVIEFDIDESRQFRLAARVHDGRKAKTNGADIPYGNLIFFGSYLPDMKLCDR